MDQLHRPRGVGTDPIRRMLWVSTSARALLGKDITTIDGLGPYLSLKLIAECGETSPPGRVQSILPLGWAGAEQQGLRRQNALVANAPVRRAGCGTSAPCGRNCRTHRHRARRVYRRLSSRIGKAKAGPPRPARSQSSSTTPYVTEWSTSIPGPRLMRHATAHE
jgi:hypothetical protein